MEEHILDQNASLQPGREAKHPSFTEIRKRRQKGGSGALLMLQLLCILSLRAVLTPNLGLFSIQTYDQKLLRVARRDI
jgi:hypothetical protein